MLDILVTPSGKIDYNNFIFGKSGRKFYDLREGMSRLERRDDAVRL
jgi:hypothetical protein